MENHQENSEKTYTSPLSIRVGQTVALLHSVRRGPLIDGRGDRFTPSMRINSLDSELMGIGEDVDSGKYSEESLEKILTDVERRIRALVATGKLK